MKSISFKFGMHWWLGSVFISCFGRVRVEILLFHVYLMLNNILYINKTVVLRWKSGGYVSCSDRYLIWVARFILS